jgi:hypothetical protein
VASCLAPQKLINKKEQMPTASQPTKIVNNLDENIKNNIKKVNKLKSITNL